MNVISFQNRAIAISLAALILTICCLCGNKVVLSNQYSRDRCDIYNLDSLITLLNKKAKRIKIDPVLGVVRYDSTRTSNGIEIRKMVLQTRKAENFISFDIRSDTIHRITVFSDRVTGRLKPAVGQVFNQVRGVLPYPKLADDGSVGLFDSVDFRIVYYFESLHGTASIDETNFKSMLQNSRIIKIVLEEPVTVYNEWHAEFK